MQKFIVGQSYGTQSIVCSETTYKMTVVSRTDKTAMVSQYGEKPRRYKIHASWDGTQEVIRMGNYSMAGSWGARDIIAQEAAPVTAKELSDNFSTEELQFIADALKEFLEPQEAEELPPNCVPFRRKVA